MSIKTAWYVIVSSRSGGGKAFRDWTGIERLLADNKIDFVAVVTDHAAHATELAAAAVGEGYRKFIVVGGDGAVNEVLNGLYLQSEVSPSELLIGLVPVGSGNDWARLHKIPFSYAAAVALIAGAGGNMRFQDVARVESIMDGKPCRRYMMNIGGLGFDAEVCRLFDKAKVRGHAGDRQYLKYLISGFFSYKSLGFTIDVDGREFYRGPAVSVALGIGKYCGGGMMQTPDALPDDGLIDLTVIGRISKLKFMIKVASLFRGTLLRHKEVLHTKGRDIHIEAEPFSYVEVDGEAAGITPVHIGIVERGIRVVSGL